MAIFQIPSWFGGGLYLPSIALSLFFCFLFHESRVLQLSVLSVELRQKLPSEVSSYKLEVLQPGIFTHAEDLGTCIVLVQNHSECSHVLL